MEELQLVIVVILRGVMIGSVYALIAMGLNLIWGVMGVVNVVHGELVMLGAYITYWAWSLLHLDPLLSLLIGAPLLFMFGVIIHRSIIERIVGEPQLSSLLLTFGLSIITWNLAQFLWTNTYRSVNADYLLATRVILGASFSNSKILSFLLAVALTLALFAFLKYTQWGKAIRATSQNADVAMVCGIDTVKVRTFIYGLGAAIAAAAGTIVSLQWVIFPQMGAGYLSKAFAIVVLGGAGSAQGALLGGLILGVLESLATQFISAQMGAVIPSLAILTILIISPTGLFGEKMT